ncbi:MAG: hypothetical protein KDA32_06300 [Phycisphaerales bacterium]|nr:hypothetical protein [Phycisphaerales bacterium]
MLRSMALLVTALTASVSFAQAQRSDSVDTRKLLSQTIPEVSFEDAPFDQVMEWVAEFTQMNVVVRWEQLEVAGVDRDKPVSIRVRNLSLSQVLWMIMSEAGGETKMAYRASGNLLVLSTADDLGKEMVVKVYDVSDLLLRVPRFDNAPRIDLQQAGQQAAQAGQGGGGGGGQGLFQDDQEDNEQDQQGDNTEIQQLIQLIMETIEPDSWREGLSGGAGQGSIRAFRSMLIVRNSIDVHQKLGGALSD